MQVNGTFLFIFCLLFLIGGYFTYGRFVEKILRPKSSRVTPAVSKCDGVDYMVLPWWKIFLIQLLNIAGLGPVYGALMGALFGPIALLWIAFGCIFFGAMHDYFSGVMSLRHGGASLPEIIGKYLGRRSRLVIRVLCVLLMVLVVVVFARASAGLLQNLCKGVFDIGALSWTIIVFAYFFAATIFPLDTIIGRIYPLFAICLLAMAGLMLWAILFSNMPILPGCELTFDAHPEGKPLWPLLFVTIACGAISGFHATQSPMMARCIRNESHCKPLFYGPMVTEGIIALIWCTVGLSFYGSVQGLFDATSGGNDPGFAVFQSSEVLLGQFGKVLTILGVVALPISTGDTALRGARLIIADALKVPQKKIWKRLAITIPLLLMCVFFCYVDFTVIWRYFNWLNQCIACMTLLCISVFLLKTGRPHWITTIPAVCLGAVCITYLLYSPECFGLPLLASSIAACFLSLFLIFWVYSKRRK